MPAKISKEVRQRIYELNKENHPVREILSILKSEGVKISDKSIYNIIKENAKNQSFVSIEVDDEGSFNESFGEDYKTDDNILPTLTREENNEGKDNNVITHEGKDDLQDKETLSLISIINQGVKEGTEQFISKLNKDISESNNKLDEIIMETKKKVNKPMSVNKNLLSLPQIIPFNTDDMTESEKRLRRDMIIKIRNYIDCFSNNEVIQSMCGNPILFKQKFYEKDLASLTMI